MRILLLLNFFLISLFGNAQISISEHKTSSDNYIKSIVGDSIFENHFTRPDVIEEEDVVWSVNVHLNLKLGNYNTHIYEITDNNDEVLQIIEIYTDSLAKVYSIDTEWYGYKNTLKGYKKYFLNEFKYDFHYAVKLVSDSLRSEKLEYKLRCNCKISEYDSRYSPQVLEGEFGKKIIISHCYEISDAVYVDYSDLGWWASKRMKRIYQIDPNTGYIIGEMFQPLSITR